MFKYASIAILKHIGLVPIFADLIPPQSIMLSETNNGIEKHGQYKKENHVLFNKIMSFVYFLLILAITSWPIVSIVITAIIERNISLFEVNINKLVAPIQLITGYFMMKSHRELSYNHMYVCIGSIISLCFACLDVIFYLTISDVDVYPFSSLKYKILIIPFFLVYKYTALCIILSNFTIFFSIFNNQRKYIESYSNRVSKLVRMEDITLSDIIESHTQQKQVYSMYVNIMNNTFSYFVIINVISLYGLSLSSPSHRYIINYVDMGIFIIAFGLYFWIIHKVNQSTEGLKNNINSYYVSTTLIEENDKVNWLIINQKVNEEWESFKILGFTINNAEIISKCIAVIMSIFMIERLREVTETVNFSV